MGRFTDPCEPKKTDVKILKAMFERNGISHTEDVDIDNNTKSFTIEDGYVGFFTIFSFDKDGKLLSVEAGE